MMRNSICRILGILLLLNVWTAAACQADEPAPDREEGLKAPALADLLKTVLKQHEIELQLNSQRKEAAAREAKAKGVSPGAFGAAVGAPMFHEPDVEAARKLLDKVPSLIHWRSRCQRGSITSSSALHFTTKAKDLKLARLLLERGHPIDATNDDGETALHLAAREGNSLIVDFLLEQKADPDFRSEHNMSPLHVAVLNQQDAVARKLSKAGGTVDLFVAAGMGDLAEVERQLRRHREVRKKYYQQLDARERSPLHYAMKNGHAEVVKALLKTGADPNISPRYPTEPPLHEAVRGGHVEAVRALLADKGTDAEVLNYDEETALHYAAWTGHVEIAKLLIEAGADVNRKSGTEAMKPCGYNYGEPHNLTPLHFAARYGEVAMIDLLIKNGAKVDVRERVGKTPLHFAVQNNGRNFRQIAKIIAEGGDVTKAEDYLTVKRLIKHGADFNQRDDGGKTPLDRVSEDAHPSLAKLLKAAGARSGSDLRKAERLKN